MAWVDMEAQEKRKQCGQSLLERMRREDSAEYRNSHSDPEFTVQDLAKITGLSERRVQEILRSAKVGRCVMRPHKSGRKKTIIVRWSTLHGLASEFGW